MIEIVQQTLEYYLKNKKIPTINEITLKNTALLKQESEVFVTLYKNGNIIGSSGNVVKIENSVVHELILNTIAALRDPRFDDLSLEEWQKLQIRIDTITSRNILEKPFWDLNPVNSGVLAIKKDYSKLSIILPNISPTLVSGNDFPKILSKKLEEDFVMENYIVYEVHTQITTNY